MNTCVIPSVMNLSFLPGNEVLKREESKKILKGRGCGGGGKCTHLHKGVKNINPVNIFKKDSVYNNCHSL